MNISLSRKLVIAGFAIYVAGLFSPIMTVPIMGGISMSGTPDFPYHVIIISILSVGAFLGWKKSVLITCLCLSGYLSWGIFEAFQHTRMPAELASNPFAKMLALKLGLSWGWIPLYMGAFFIMASTFNTEPLKKLINGDV